MTGRVRQRRSLVPDHSGTQVIEFYRGELETDPPTHATYPVLAWLVTVYVYPDREDSTYADPVTYEDLGDVWCLETPDGHGYMFPHDRVFDTFDQARDYARERLARVKR